MTPSHSIHRLGHAHALITVHREAGDAGHDVAVAVIAGHRTFEEVTTAGREASASDLFRDDAVLPRPSVTI
jgi:hypothetical protein